MQEQENGKCRARKCVVTLLPWATKLEHRATSLAVEVALFVSRFIRDMG
jgi:hypothetical protein